MLSRADLAASFSYALDLTEGQPAGHSLRASYIAGRVANAIGLSAAECDRAHYATLLKDLGCSSNAARIAELYGADDRGFKQRWKTVPLGLPATLGFVFRETGRDAPFAERISAIANIMRNGDAIAQELIVSRCSRGAAIARDLRLGEGVAGAIYHLDEHWDGSGRPDGLMGDAIPLEARLALLAQVADVFHRQHGREAAIAEVAGRSGSWLDPHLARAFACLAGEDAFWSELASPTLEAIVTARLAPSSDPVDEDFLDAITAAFGKVVDAKSPYTAGHSDRVALYSQALGTSMGMSAGRVRQLRRAAALHDIGKLGVSSAVLEKPGQLTADEWAEMRDHAGHTATILRRIGPFERMAAIAAAHHERLDGRGYPQGLTGQAIARETRIITVCDFYDALTADRPYRAAMSSDRALAIMDAEQGTAVDPDCLAALKVLINK